MTSVNGSVTEARHMNHKQCDSAFISARPEGAILSQPEKLRNIYIAPWGMRGVYLTLQSHKQASPFQFCRFRYVFGNGLMNFSCHYKAWYTYSIRRHLRQASSHVPWLSFKGVSLHVICETFLHNSRPLNSWQPIFATYTSQWTQKNKIKYIVNRLSSEKS